MSPDASSMTSTSIGAVGGSSAIDPRQRSVTGLPELGTMTMKTSGCPGSGKLICSGRGGSRMGTLWLETGTRC